MLSDIEIAQKAKMQPIGEVAGEARHSRRGRLEPYGHYKAKVSLDYVELAGRQAATASWCWSRRSRPTPAGEGKTTTTIGPGRRAEPHRQEGDGLPARAVARPVFGMKGGAAGGGYAQVVPMEDINLHFTGDFHAIALANNLLAAMIDNHIHHGNELGIDVRRIAWQRVVDMNDRALRDIIVGLGGTANGLPREDGFDIAVASEVMAIFCLSTSLADLKERLGRHRRRLHAATRSRSAPAT